MDSQTNSLLFKIQSLLKSKLFGDASSYFLSNVIAGIIPFLALPFITAIIAPSDYGVFALFTAISSFMAPIAALGLNFAIRKRYYELEADGLRTYIFNCVFISLIASLTALPLVLLIFGFSFQSLLSFPIYWLGAIIFIAFVRSLFGQYQILLTMVHGRKKYASLMIANTALIYCFILLFYFGLSQDSWEMLVIAQIASAVLLGAMIIGFLFKEDWLRFRLSLPNIKNALTYGAPLLPYLLAFATIMAADRFFIQYFLKEADVGIYAIGFQIGYAVFLLSTSVGQAWNPWFYKMMQDDTEQSKHQIVRLNYIIIGVMIMIVAGFFVISPYIVDLFVSDSYARARDITPWIGLAFGIYSIYMFLGHYLYFAEKTALLSLLMIITALLNIGFNYYLIPIFGMVGAAYATALSFAVASVITIFIVRRLFAMPWWQSFKALLRQA